MFFDPGTKTETKADPLSLTSLIAWLEKRDQSKSYNYGCNGGCLLALYFRAQGFEGASMGSMTWFYYEGEKSIRMDMPPHFDEIAVGGGTRLSHTFGAALERARKLAG